MKKSITSEIKQKQHFSIEAVDVGDLEKIVVTKGPGDSWMLNQMIVKAGQFGPVEHTFIWSKYAFLSGMIFTNSFFKNIKQTNNNKKKNKRKTNPTYVKCKRVLL